MHSCEEWFDKLALHCHAGSWLKNDAGLLYHLCNPAQPSGKSDVAVCPEGAQEAGDDAKERQVQRDCRSVLHACSIQLV